MAAPKPNKQFANVAPAGTPVISRRRFGQGFAAAMGLAAAGTVVNAVVGANDAEAQSAAVTPAALADSKPVSPIEAKALSMGKILFHYGEGVYGVRNSQTIIEQDNGLPVVVVPGGPPGRVVLLVNGEPTGVFTQSDINRGTLILTALEKYRRVFSSVDNDGVEPG